MKTNPKLTTLKILLALCCAFATQAVFGQYTHIYWVNTYGAPAGVELGNVTNWSSVDSTPGTVPTTPNPNTILTFDGLVAGPQNVVGYVGIVPGNGTIGGGGGSAGAQIELTGNQISPVTITAGQASSSMGLNALIMDANSATLTLGDTSANQMIFVHRPGAGTDTWQNNSTNPMVIMPNAQIQNGGGNAGHIIDYEGTGNFYVTNNLRWNNGAPAQTMVWGGNSWTGTNIWAAGGANDLFNSSVGAYDIFSGTVVITTAGLFPTAAGQANTVTLDSPGIMVLDGTGQSDTILRTISGNGNIVIKNGTWTMGAANTYSGNDVLNGGEMVAGFAETFGTQGPIGEGNQIVFNGGTLGYSSVNNFDYSSEFSTAAGQQYSIDTGSQDVTLATGLASSGGSLAKFGSGTLTLTGSSTYSGSTVINAGRVAFQGGKSGTGSITVADSAILGVYSGTQVVTASLTVGTSSGGTLGFNNVSSTSTALIVATNLSTVGTVTININSGTFTVGDVYPLFTWNTGSAPTVSLGVLNGYTGTLSINGNAVDLTITGTAFSWTGGSNGSWDETTGGNWLRNGASATFSDGIPALLDDSATGTTTLTVGTLVQPSVVTFNNSAKAYSVASSGANRIGGSGGLTVSGSGNVTLSGGANTYTGVTTLDSGDLTVSNLSNGGLASDIGAAANSAANFVFNGGTLTYGGGAASIDRAFTLGSAGGTIAASGTGPLNLNSTGTIGISGSGSRALTLSGTDLTDTNILAAVIADGGGGQTSLAMSGAGIWTLTGANTYSGGTTINGGVLVVSGAGTLGTGGVSDSGNILFNASGAVTVNTIIGNGSVTNEGTGTVTLPGNNSYTGGTTVNAGSTLQVGNGGSTGTLSEDTAVLDNGTLVFNTTGTANLSAAPINGTGNVHVTGTGALLEIIANNTYTGWTLIDSGSTLEPFRGNSGALISSIVTNNGTLYCVCQNIWPTGFGYSNNIVGSGQAVKDNNNGNPGDIVIAGTNNTYTGGTLIEGGGFVLGDGVDANSGNIVGSVKFANTASGFLNPRWLRFNFAPGTTVFTNPIFSAVTDGSQTIYQGSLEQLGPGQVTLTGTNSYPGYTVIDSGATLQVGNGGTTGALGSSAIYNGGMLIYDLSANTTVSDNISDTTNLPYSSVQAADTRGSLEQLGSGTLTLTGTASTYSGTNFVMNGGLFLNGNDAATNTLVTAGTFGGSGTVAGSITTSAGTLLVPGGAIGSVGTLTVTNTYVFTSGTNTYLYTNPSGLSIGGNVLIAVNKGLAQSNSMVVVNPGTITYSGSGTLTVTNVGGTPVAVGDTYTVFNGAVTGGGSLAITGAGANWVNHLASNGTITVQSIIVTTPPTIGLVRTSSTSMTLSWSNAGSDVLQAQTNSLVGTWFDYPGGATSPVLIPITTNSVFFRLGPP
ncbi:MAG TPA: autotransporter-associated beta strand repeat-containing protein [Verrucomicrobiae bacterium]|jgi:autotransporter-associated beta strand protein